MVSTWLAAGDVSPAEYATVHITPQLPVTCLDDGPTELDTAAPVWVITHIYYMVIT